MKDAVVAFQTLIRVYQTTRRYIPGTFNIMLHTFVLFKGTLMNIGVLTKGLVHVKRWLCAEEEKEG